MILHDFPFVYKTLTNSRDKDGNTLVHSAALTGNARLFKVGMFCQSSRSTKLCV